MNTTINTLSKNILPFLRLILISYFFSLVIFYVLPKTGVEYIPSTSDVEIFEKYHIFDNLKPVKVKPVLQVEKKSYEILSSLLLSAIYSEDDGNGWIMVKEKKSSLTHVLQKGDDFKNYTLKYLFPNYVIFEKDMKEYKLYISNNKNKFEIVSDKNSKWNEKTTFTGDEIKIKRTIVNSYINDMNKVWDDIKITEFKRNGSVIGYKVVKIAKNSLFYNLGLSSDDLITEINDTKLDNYQKVFKIYKQIKNVRFLKIKILRKNKEMELNYEIN